MYAWICICFCCRLLTFSFVFIVTCVSHAFASVHCCLVVTCWERADFLALVGDVYCIFVTFPCSILGQVWYSIVSFPDLCRLSYFFKINFFKNYFRNAFRVANGLLCDCTSVGQASRLKNLSTHVRKQPIIALYFEFKNELKSHNLESRPHAH